MAERRGRKSTESDSTTTSTEVTEAPVPSEETAVTESTTTPESAPEPTTSESHEPDLTAFNQAVKEAVAAADTATGDVPEEQLAKVTAAYRALEGIKAKNAAKAVVNERMKDAMNNDDLPGARANLNISEKALVAAAASGRTTAPADPTENFVQRVATLNLAYNLATQHVPDGVSEDWNEKAGAMATDLNEAANEYFAWTQADPESRGEEPEVSVVVRNAAKLATGKAAKAGVSRGGGSFTGDRRDIGEHILNAFADEPEGSFLTIAQIRSKRSDEYGDSLPSAGAISARLFPRGGGESSMVKVGIRPDTQDGKKGAVKVAVSE